MLIKNSIVGHNIKCFFTAILSLCLIVLPSLQTNKVFAEEPNTGSVRTFFYLKFRPITKTELEGNESSKDSIDINLEKDEPEIIGHTLSVCALKLWLPKALANISNVSDKDSSDLSLITKASNKEKAALNLSNCEDVFINEEGKPIIFYKNTDQNSLLENRKQSLSDDIVITRERIQEEQSYTALVPFAFLTIGAVGSIVLFSAAKGSLLVPGCALGILAIIGAVGFYSFYQEQKIKIDNLQSRLNRYFINLNSLVDLDTQYNNIDTESIFNSGITVGSVNVGADANESVLYLTSNKNIISGAIVLFHKLLNLDTLPTISQENAEQILDKLETEKEDFLNNNVVLIKNKAK